MFSLFLQKVSRMAAMERAWATAMGPVTAAEASLLFKKDPVLLNATRFALKLAEHTWGRDVKSNLRDNFSWKNADFERAKASGSPNASQYNILEESWWEQRQWGVTLAMETLRDGDHPLFHTLQTAFAELRPAVPDVSSAAGYSGASIGTPISCGDGLTLTLDDTGAITGLTHKGGTEWADATHPLSALRYKSYNLDDVDNFMDEYCKDKASWVAKDYGKPGLPADTASKMWVPAVQAVFVRDSNSNSGGVCSIVAVATFEDEAWQNYGAPQQVWTEYTVSSAADSGTVGVNIGLFNKTRTRLPESMFVQWHPRMGASGDGGGAATTTSWAARSLGAWVETTDVVGGGSKRMFGADAVRATAADDSASTSQQMEVTSLDALVASFGRLNAYPTPTNATANTAAYGASHVLWDNLWGTNYIMWWPFVVPPPAPYGESATYFPQDGNNDFAARFTITL